MRFLRLYLFMMTVFCVDIMSMQYELGQANTGIMLEPETLVIGLIIQNPFLLDHDTVCSLAYVNKSCNKLILDGVSQRKALLTQNDTAEVKNTALFCACGKSKRLFHRYGSSYAVAEKLTDVDGDRKILNLLRRYLTGNGKMAQASRTFQEFCFFVDENLAPFWNKEGFISFYGCGEVQIGRSTQTCLMRYDLDETVMLSPHFSCFLRMKNKEGTIISESPINNEVDRSALVSFLQNKKISLNTLFAFKEIQKRYSYFGESTEEVVVIEIVKEK